MAKKDESVKSTVSKVTMKVQEKNPKEVTEQAVTPQEDAVSEIPALPADFQTPPNPLNDFANSGGLHSFNSSERFMQDGKFTPYRTHTFGDDNKPNLIVEKSNELARSIWADATAYAKANVALSSIDQNKDYLKESFIANRKFYDQGHLSMIISQSLGISGGGSFGATYLYGDKIEELIRKLKRLERKNNSEEIFDDNAREQIINYVLLPTNTAGSWYDRYGSLNLSYPEQKVVINEILTKDEVNSISTILSYIPRVRKLLGKCFEPTNRLNREQLGKNLSHGRQDNTDDGRPYFPAMSAGYSNPDSHGDKLETMLAVHRFLNSVIPYDIIRDLSPNLSQSGNNMSMYSLDMHNASKAMREASLNYIREERGLGELLQKIVDYSAKLSLYFNYVNSELHLLFGLLNRLEISYETLLNDSDDYLINSVPW